MKDELITYPTAELAKEKGFDEVCYAFYSGVIENELHRDWDATPKIWKIDKKIFLAPTQSLLQKWLREKHKIIISIPPSEYFEETGCFHYRLTTKKYYSYPFITNTSYEGMLEIALQEALKLIVI